MSIRTAVTCLAVAVFLVMGVAIAQEDIPKIIHFKGAADGGGSKDIYPSIYTGPVKFAHEKHAEEYGEGCGDCHHDENVDPIVEYDPDESYICSDCHSEKGLIRGPIAENAALDEDLIAHRANVIHKRCIGCHRNYNAEKKSVLAPVSCRTCHEKRPQDWRIK